MDRKQKRTNTPLATVSGCENGSGSSEANLKIGILSMCGVVGCFQFGKNKNSPFKIDRDYLIQMRDTMIHRGPDDSGFWINSSENMGLAHRRLSIIDLSKKATQPMLDPSGQYAIVFNGEIYNYKEIKEDLKKEMDIQWQTDHSDTEVLLHAYKVWGKDCLKRLRGMFAFAVWDEKRSELFIARDRIGIKPLYYTIIEDRFVFASEIKALLKDKGCKPKVNEKSFLSLPVFFDNSLSPDSF